MATVMVVGSGGREMAQALALAKSAAVAKVLVAPGNGGTASCHPKISNLSDVKDDDVAGLVAAAKKHAANLVAIGPEAPLVAGIADALALENIPCFGPTKLASELENSKAWMKEFFVRHGLPTARHVTFTDFAAAKAHVEAIDYPVVVKCSGLAGGKGVLMPTTKEETVEALKQVMVDKAFGSAGDECVVEECMFGPECSVLAFCDGTTAVCMPGAQDHKRALAGDLGLNTGGMGAYARCPCLTPALEAEAAAIVQKTVAALASEGRKYVGVLFAGLMLTKDGPKLLEYNCRMGDPETQVLRPHAYAYVLGSVLGSVAVAVAPALALAPDRDPGPDPRPCTTPQAVLPLLESDLYLVMKACTEGSLAAADVTQLAEITVSASAIAAPHQPARLPSGPRAGLRTPERSLGLPRSLRRRPVARLRGEDCPHSGRMVEPFGGDGRDGCGWLPRQLQERRTHLGPRGGGGHGGCVLPSSPPSACRVFPRRGTKNTPAPSTHTHTRTHTHAHAHTRTHAHARLCARVCGRRDRVPCGHQGGGRRWGWRRVQRWPGTRGHGCRRRPQGSCEQGLRGGGRHQV